MNTATFLEELDHLVAQEWEQIRNGEFWQLVEKQGVSRELWKLTLTQIYHYTKHNSINQAVAAYHANPEHMDLLRFVYRHASEELGHENMIVRDLNSIGIDAHKILEASPLAPTQALIGYLYFVAQERGAIARLGYSFWAEDVYDYIEPLLDTARHDLSLTERNLTFFVAHSKIDSKHSVEVRDMIKRYAVSESQQSAVQDVAMTSLYLTGGILNDIARHYMTSQGLEWEDRGIPKVSAGLN